MYSESCDSACVNIGGADKEYICFIARQRLLYLLGKVFNSIKQAITPIGTLRDVVVMFEIKLCKKENVRIVLSCGSNLNEKIVFFIVRPFVNIRLD